MKRENHGTAEIREIINRNRTADSFTLRWQVTALCNYACGFCIQGTKEAHAAAAREESSERRRAICGELVRFAETELRDVPRLHLYLIGGEVSILHDFPALLETLLSSRYPGEMRVYITTNLSMPAEYYVTLCRLFSHSYPGRRSLSLSASFYRQYTEVSAFAGKMRNIAKAAGVRSKLGTFLEKKAGALTGKTLCDPVSLTMGFPILCDADYRSCRRWKRKLRNRISVDPILIRNYPTRISAPVNRRLQAAGKTGIEVHYADGRVRCFQGMQQLGAANGRAFQPRGYLCDAGMAGLSVDAGGAVFRCPVLDAPESHRLGSLPGEKPLRRPDRPALCEAGHCSCNYFRHIRRAGETTGGGAQ